MIDIRGDLVPAPILALELCSHGGKILDRIHQQRHPARFQREPWMTSHRPGNPRLGPTIFSLGLVIQLHPVDRVGIGIKMLLETHLHAQPCGVFAPALGLAA